MTLSPHRLSLSGEELVETVQEKKKIPVFALNPNCYLPKECFRTKTPLTALEHSLCSCDQETILFSTDPAASPTGLRSHSQQAPCTTAVADARSAETPQHPRLDAGTKGLAQKTGPSESHGAALSCGLPESHPGFYSLCRSTVRLFQTF